MIRDATLDDSEAIARIYNHYIEHTAITFEEQPVSANEMGERISRVIPHLPWLVLEENDRVAGYACATRWNT